MHQIRYNVFGQLLAIQRDNGTWSAFVLGPDGKRRQADFIIPDFITEDDLGQFLYDLFHESAMPWNGEVIRLD